MHNIHVTLLLRITPSTNSIGIDMLKRYEYATDIEQNNSYYMVLYDK